MGDPANGQVTLTAGTTLGQIAVYSCNTGYNLVGDRTLTCQTSGNWSGSEPTCEGVYVVNLACSHLLDSDCPVCKTGGRRHLSHELCDYLAVLFTTVRLCCTYSDV